MDFKSFQDGSAGRLAWYNAINSYKSENYVKCISYIDTYLKNLEKKHVKNDDLTFDTMLLNNNKIICDILLSNDKSKISLLEQLKSQAHRELQTTTGTNASNIYQPLLTYLVICYNCSFFSPNHNDSIKYIIESFNITLPIIFTFILKKSAVLASTHKTLQQMINDSFDGSQYLFKLEPPNKKQRTIEPISINDTLTNFKQYCVQAQENKNNPRLFSQLNSTLSQLFTLLTHHLLSSNHNELTLNHLSINQQQSIITHLYNTTNSKNEQNFLQTVNNAEIQYIVAQLQKSSASTHTSYIPPPTNPSSHPSHKLLSALIHYQQSNVACESLLQECIQSNTHVAQCTNLLGCIKSKQSDHSSAIHYFLKSIQLFNQNDDQDEIIIPTFNLSIQYQKTNQHYQQEKMLSFLLKLTRRQDSSSTSSSSSISCMIPKCNLKLPNSTSVIYMMANCYLSSKKYSMAISAYHHLISILKSPSSSSPSHSTIDIAQLYTLYIYSLLMDDHVEIAYDYCNQVLKMDPDHTLVLLYKSDALISMERADQECLDALNHLINVLDRLIISSKSQIRNQMIRACNNRGLVYKCLNLKKKALDDFNTAYLLCNVDELSDALCTCFNLSLLHLENGDLNKSVKLWFGQRHIPVDRDRLYYTNLFERLLGEYGDLDLKDGNRHAIQSHVTGFCSEEQLQSMDLELLYRHIKSF
ncbi:bcsC [Acrasis kona]|uniref:BcsC n=1 Tax=Acrasis kona TaxID=1008807 RepID=A0AAW2Z7Z3_9EUKA